MWTEKNSEETIRKGKNWEKGFLGGEETCNKWHRTRDVLKREPANQRGMNRGKPRREGKGRKGSLDFHVLGGGKKENRWGDFRMGGAGNAIKEKKLVFFDMGKSCKGGPAKKKKCSGKSNFKKKRT